MEPQIFTDKSRFQEIYDLRILSYENSNKSVYINRHIFPNGWKDDLDDEAIHWVIELDGRIVAATRNTSPVSMILPISIIRAT